MEKIALSPRVRLVVEEVPAGKTDLLTVTFYLPSVAENPALAGFVAELISNGWPTYAEPVDLARTLADWYGASLSAGVTKVGDSFALCLMGRAVSAAFVPGKEKPLTEVAALMIRQLKGVMQTALDSQTDRRETRLYRELIQSVQGDKRREARKKALQIACAGEEIGLDKLGTEEDLDRIDRPSVPAALTRLISGSSVTVAVVGHENEKELGLAVATEINAMLGEKCAVLTDKIRPAQKTRCVTERQQLTQGKLVMVFRSGDADALKNRAVFTVLNGCFGGGPHSKLFVNVREKRGLCYYCSAAPVMSKGLILVESGVEGSKAQEAEQAVSDEFFALQNGILSEEELAAAKRVLVNRYGSMKDDPDSLSSWFSGNGKEDFPPDLSDYAAAVEAVTAEEVVHLAQTFSLDTAYTLLPEVKES